jgi:signal transduction histidine kinase
MLKLSVIKYQPSIQNKVKFGYYICIALIVVISTLNYLNLNRIERKIAFSFTISDLFDATLEMRRFEKNYIIYKDRTDYLENLRFTEKAEDIIRGNKESIKELSVKTDVYDLGSDINKYKTLMKRYYELDKTLNPVDAYRLEGQIRENGKRLVDATENISTVERRYIQSLILFSNVSLLISIITITIVGCLIGHYLSRMVVSPLKRLEDNMQKIADGKFDICESLSPGSSDREVLSLSNACSRMIKELEARQMKVILQSEKLISLGTMVSGIAHQLNNPLSNISTSCQILQEEIGESDMEYKKELLGQIEEQVERAKAMTHSLLEFSRKKESPQKSPLSLKSLMADTIRLLQGDIPTGVELGVDMPEDVWIIADKQRMQQAFLNIIKNGIDAIPDEGMVFISTEEDTENNVVVIRIKDTGTGIEPETKERIFDPFFTTKEEGKGSGLGLFVAKEIIEEHGGIIEVESESGRGTTFTIKLLLKEH